MTLPRHVHRFNTFERALRCVKALEALRRPHLLLNEVVVLLDHIVQIFHAPEINKRIRQHLKMSGTSYRVDETYIKVGKSCKYLYRAVDKEGQTIEFMLSAKRDVSAAKRFFRKLKRAEDRRLPFSISVDKNAAYPEAFSTSQAERIVPKDCKLRRVKYLNNVIEQDHRFVKKKVRASQCFKHFHTAERTLEGIEAVNMMRKGQVKRLAGSDAMGQARLVASLFQIAA